MVIFSSLLVLRLKLRRMNQYPTAPLCCDAIFNCKDKSTPTTLRTLPQGRNDVMHDHDEPQSIPKRRAAYKQEISPMSVRRKTSNAVGGSRKNTRLKRDPFYPQTLTTHTIINTCTAAIEHPRYSNTGAMQRSFPILLLNSTRLKSVPSRFSHDAINGGFK